MLQEAVEKVRAYRNTSLQAVDPAISWSTTPETPASPRELARALLTDHEFSITEDCCLSDMLTKLRKREFTVEEVTRAFLRRAAIAQHATNCLTELMWDDAIARARYLDSLPEARGALFGLPISIKENQGMRGDGKTCNSGFAAWAEKPSRTEIYLHDILWDAGCVFYARTTLPQTVMHLETNSLLYGRTTNPYNDKHTSGGSSGGEGALIGMRGSLLGLGGDVGGSIRVPAAFNGIYGFKPTVNRFPGSGAPAPMAGSETIIGVNGPMSTDREGLDLMMRVVLDAQPWRRDPSIVPQTWTPYRFDRPLKIAIQMSDKVVTPHPPIIRALNVVWDACRQAGMKVVEWDSLNHERAWEITSALYFPDGGKDMLETLREVDEPLLPLTDFIIRQQPHVKAHDLEGLWKLCLERDAFRSKYAEHWNSTDADDGQEVDVIVAPAYPGAAPPHDCARYWGYTSIWNLLDYPAAVFPVTTVSDKDEKDLSYQPMNEQDRYNHDLYDPVKYAGLPVSLQVIGRKGHDEKVLAALSRIENALA